MAWLPWSKKHQPFTYPSLSAKPRAFRVFKLLAPIKSSIPPFRETLRIQILETDVDGGDYDTLSYCWGNGKPDREVRVVSSSESTCEEDQTLYISASLEAALLSLAHDDGKLETRRPIFADQICVNQRDHVEKVAQVRLMGAIYARSAITIVWLGPETTGSTRYFDYVTEVCGEGVMSRLMGPNSAHLMNVFDAVMDSSIELETENEREDREDMLRLMARFGPSFPVHDLAAVLRRAWVGRLWTVQEGCLPARVTFRCGGRELCFECFRAGLLFYSFWTTFWMRTLKAPVHADEVRARDEIYTLNNPILRLRQERRAIHGKKMKRRSLYEIVLKYNVNDDARKMGATKAEDRVYALLGLAEPDGLVGETMEKMVVDNVRNTYTNFAAAVMKRDMDVLLFAQVPKSSEHGGDLPSWVPDWSSEKLRLPCGYADLSTPVFAAGGCPAGGDFRVDIATGTLRVSAVPVGRVMRVGMQTVQGDETSITQNIEYRSVRRFFDEIDSYMDAAATINSANAPKIADAEDRLKALIRLSDGGLSVRQFPTTFDPGTALDLLRRIHTDVSHMGKFFLDADAKSRVLSTFTGMIRTMAVVPWYWTPASEIDVVRLCATDPIAAAKQWATGLFLAMIDVAHVIWYVNKIRFHSVLLAISRIRARRNFHRPNDEAVFSNVGLHLDLVFRQEWAHYTNNLLKMMGRRCFVTDTGFVGLGPSHLRVDDAVVVVPGSSVPHVLRRLETPGSDDGFWDTSSWSYVGEAYCDGIMDGELVSGEIKKTQLFQVK